MNPKGIPKWTVQGSSRNPHEPTWAFQVQKCNKYSANERLKSQNVANTMQNGSRTWPNVANTMQNASACKVTMPKSIKYYATCKVSMRKRSKDHAQWQILVANCCKHKANGTRKGNKQQIPNLSQAKKSKNSSEPVLIQHVLNKRSLSVILGISCQAGAGPGLSWLQPSVWWCRMSSTRCSWHKWLI